MLYFLLFFAVIAAIFFMIYLIYVQNTALRIERLKQIYYSEDFAQINQQFRSKSRESQEKTYESSTKRLSFRKAFEFQDRILFTNAISFENLQRNRQILGSSPRKTANSKKIAENRGNLVEIDLSKENCSFFAENLEKTCIFQENPAKFKEKSKKTRVLRNENKENVDFNRFF